MVGGRLRSVWLCRFSSCWSRFRSRVMFRLVFCDNVGVVLSSICLCIFPSSTAAVLLSCGDGDFSSWRRSSIRWVFISAVSAFMRSCVPCCVIIWYTHVLLLLSVFAMSVTVVPWASRAIICLAYAWFFSSVAVIGWFSVACVSTL